MICRAVRQRTRLSESEVGHLVGCGSTCVESGSIRVRDSDSEYQESRSEDQGWGYQGSLSDIRESGPTEYPGYLKDIRDIRNQNQGFNTGVH